ncbi:MAG: hypothetical protein GXO38_02795 [Epsilonproteobacteria bacterium]|nr:hypothetical protein [Campylobacterota bacterium]
MTLYLYRRGETLYFVLKHPGFAMEVNYNTKLIKDILTTLAQRYKACRHIKITQIRAYAKFVQEPKPSPKWHHSYKERATGEFRESQEFPELFAKIKEAIRRNVHS